MSRDCSIANHRVFGPKAFKIFCVLLSLLITLHLLLWLSIVLKDKSLKGLDSKWQLLQPKKIELDALTSEVEQAKKLLLPMGQLTGRGILWSEKLNALSDLIPNGMWFRRIYVEEDVNIVGGQKNIQMFNIEGSIAPVYGNPEELFNGFIKSLRENEDFSRGFGEIKHGVLENTVFENNPIVNFGIFCILKED